MPKRNGVMCGGIECPSCDPGIHPIDECLHHQIPQFNENRNRKDSIRGLMGAIGPCSLGGQAGNIVEK